MALSLMTMVSSPANALGTSTAATYQYLGFTCCQQLGADPVFHPGEYMNLQWQSEWVGTGSTSRYRVTLNTQVIGPFSSLKKLKQSWIVVRPNEKQIDVKARTLRVLNNYARAPFSIVKIPAHAPAGYYELQFSTLENGVTSSGATFVQVRPLH
jgi:hypothetical protein